jgi:hypothetical protein
MLPTFILAGVEKSGSTSLYHYLSQHPDIFMADPKEPNYFLGSGPVREEGAYRALFDAARPGQARGEASVGYMNDPRTAGRIQALIPDVEILVVLRHPVERAYSHYNMLVNAGVIPNRPYIDALWEAQRTSNFFNTGVPTSRYYESLREFKTIFGGRLHIHFYEDVRTDPRAVLQSIFAQVGVDASFVPDVSASHNRTHRPRSSRALRLIRRPHLGKKAMHSLLPEWVYARLKRFLERANRAPVPALTDEARALLTRVLRTDIQKTEDLLQADLSHWRGEGNASSSAGPPHVSVENSGTPADPTSSSNSHPR